MDYLIHAEFGPDIRKSDQLRSSISLILYGLEKDRSLWKSRFCVRSIANTFVIRDGVR